MGRMFGARAKVSSMMGAVCTMPMSTSARKAW